MSALLPQRAPRLLPELPPQPPPRLLPRRDAGARDALTNVARQVRPVTEAHERRLDVPGPLGDLIPGSGLVRGSTVVVDGVPGAGATSVVFALAAAATTAGEWAAAVDLDGTLGGLAAAEAGVVLDRFVVARRVPPDRWATAVAVLLDGVALVLAEVPRALRAPEARRLVARARERGAVLVTLNRGASWPAEAALRIRAAGGPWPGLDAGSRVLVDRVIGVEVEGRGAAAKPRTGGFARAV